MDTPITRAEHEEFRRTVEAEFDNLTNEDKRINKRITALEKITDEINSLTRSVDRMTTNIATMCKTQEAQGTRLEALEGRDGEKWRATANYFLSALIGAAVTAAAGFFL